MTVFWKGDLRIAFCLLLALLAGCGGGGGTSTVSNPTRGALELHLQFPTLPAGSRAIRKAPTPGRAYAGNIPLGTQVVKVIVTNPNTNQQLAPPRLVTGPQGSGGGVAPAVTVDFANLPAGPVRVQALAYPDAKAALNPIAVGATDGTIVALQTTTVNVTLSLTLATLAITPKTVTLISNAGAASMVTLTAEAANATGQPLLYPFMWVSSDPGIASIAYDPNNPGTATVTALAPGTSTITLVEPNSGMIATATVTVPASR